MKINLLIDSIDIITLVLIFSGINRNVDISSVINRKANTVSDRLAKLEDLDLIKRNPVISLTRKGKAEVEKMIKKTNIFLMSNQIEEMSI